MTDEALQAMLDEMSKLRKFSLITQAPNEKLTS
jgi:hypothetical protein